MNNMITADRWDLLADVLRDEFSEYGGLLALLNEQQQGIVHRNPEWLSERNLVIEQQAVRANEFRIRRERMVRECAIDLGLAPNVPLPQLLRLAPPATIPMFEALMDGCRATAEKVQAKLHSNRALLMRIQNVTQEMLQKLQPASTTNSYNRRGAYFKSLQMQGRGVNITA